MLAELREGVRAAVTNAYEHRAKSCSACSTPGACCLDEHFVNVRISRLEANAILKALDPLPGDVRRKVAIRTEAAIEKYELFDQQNERFACPLYEKGVGCLVHHTAKPMPCIVHACYDAAEDLPPGEILDRAELAAADLDCRAYGRPTLRFPIPVAISKTY